MRAKRLQIDPQPGPVLAKAVLRGGEILGLSQSTLGRVLGISGSQVSRMKDGYVQLDPDSKPWEHALLFVRLFRSLQALVGERDDLAQAWLESENEDLGDVPSQMITRTEGLVRAVHYLDAARGRI